MPRRPFPVGCHPAFVPAQKQPLIFTGLSIHQQNGRGRLELRRCLRAGYLAQLRWFSSSCAKIKKSAMTRTAAAAVTAILLSCPTVVNAESDQIRAKLLGTPVWAYKLGQSKDHSDVHGAHGKVETGKVSFTDKDGKLVAAIDEGLKCDNEVRLRADGFDLEDCWGRDLQYVRSGNEFKASFSSTNFTIRPAP